MRVLDALDREPTKPRMAWLPSAGSGRLHVPGPLAAGGMAAALILVAALVVVPGLGRGPAASGIVGYPADRALTSIELAVLMAGPALPVNATLVASVTIDAKTDVCPMDRYPTIGIVEAMGSQVCVMGSTLAETMTAPSATGTFAFRYIAPGHLGLLGEITAASGSRLAYHVADEWPLGGKTFVVDGWLGSAGLVYSCPSSEGPGDALSPGGGDCPDDNWLADSSNAPQMGEAPPAIGTLAIAPNGNARYVEADSARTIDGIGDTPPVRGVYVVRAVTGPCADRSPASSVGCPVWRVLAKVADVSLPGPTATATTAPSASAGPTASPVAASPSADQPETPVADPSASQSTSLEPNGISGPGGTPMNWTDLALAWKSDPAHLAGRIVITMGPVQADLACVTSFNFPETCRNLTDAYSAVRVGSDGRLSIVGELATPNGQFVVSGAVLDVDRSQVLDEYVLVDGSLEYMNLACDVAYPSAPRCSPSWLDSGGVIDMVQQSAYERFGGTSPWPPIRGIFLVHVCTACQFDEILARISPVG
jgi:hypothetical protein